MNTRNGGTFATNKWALSEKEENILGKKLVNAYEEKVEKYLEEKHAQTALSVCYMTIGFSSLLIAVSIVINKDLMESHVPLHTRVMILAAICSSTLIMSTALGVFIGRNTEVKGVQNPKDWKTKILRQKTSIEQDDSKEIGKTL